MCSFIIWCAFPMNKDIESKSFRGKLLRASILHCFIPENRKLEWIKGRVRPQINNITVEGVLVMHELRVRLGYICQYRESHTITDINVTLQI